MALLTQSYVHGASATPLSARPSAPSAAGRRRGAGPAGARHPASERPLDLCRSPPPLRGSGGGSAQARLTKRRPDRHLGGQLQRMGAGAVRDGARRPHPGQHQPGLPQPRIRLCDEEGRLPGADPEPRPQDQRLFRLAPRDSRPRSTRPSRAGSRPPACRRSKSSSVSAPTRRRACSISTTSPDGGAGRAGQALAAFEASLQFDDPINIQFTSGTTGAPKGATLTHHNIVNNGFFIGEAMRLTQDDRLCIPVPYYHCFGMVLGNLACVTHGACMVSPSEGFDPLATLEAVAGGALHRPAWRADDVHRACSIIPNSPGSISRTCAPASWPARPARSR